MVQIKILEAWAVPVLEKAINDFISDIPVSNVFEIRIIKGRSGSYVATIVYQPFMRSERRSKWQ